MAAEVLQTWREDRAAGHRGSGTALALRLLATAAIPLGMLLYLGYWAGRGSMLAPLHYQAANWQRVPTFPLVALASAFRG